MGDLDDAIREHLELKRKHGASEQEVALKQQEAQKQGALPSDPGAAPVSESAVPDLAEPEIEPEPAPPTSEVAEEAFEPSTSLAEELDPDEVLPEEALEPDVPPAAGAAEIDDTTEPEEDLLEETPEFLDEVAEQDRLWFEQRPPKDFDFDD
jgi:hypothetical protein